MSEEKQASQEEFSSRPIDYDEVLVKHVGEFGPFQRRIYVLLGMTWVPTAYMILNVVFIAATPKHHCKLPAPLSDNHTAYFQDLLLPKVQNSKGEYEFDECHMYAIAENFSTVYTMMEFNTTLNESQRELTTCTNGWTYDTSIYTSTIVSQWDLVCDRKVLVTISKSVFMAGLIAGCLMFGSVTDRFGRRPTILALGVVVTVLNIGIGFAESITLYIVLRFLVGASLIGIVNACFVEVIEYCGPNWRVFCGVCLDVFWCIGTFTLVLFAYLVRDYWKLHWILTGSCGLFLLYFCTIPESARWLYVTKREEKGNKLLMKLAKHNNKSLPTDLIVQTKAEQKGTILDLVRTPNMRKKTLIVCFNWFTSSLLYYFLTLNTAQLVGSPYLNFFLSILVEVPAFIICLFLFKRIGRRITQSAALLLGGIALLLIIPLPKETPPEVIATLTNFGKFCTAASFRVVYQFSGELMPTGIRTIGLSTGSMCARIGGVLAPLVYDLGEHVDSQALPLIICGTCSLLGGFLSLLLPETKGKKLPESLEDGENFGKKQKKDEGQTNILMNEILLETNI